ncbi:MAG TPA: hypothetical protein PK653_07355 [Syntrophales bacterium]|nr:hypothetical protein [Syntrophales bacterium]
MKQLTKEEFEDRLLALQRAKRIFIETGLTKNISVAFEVYQQVLAEKDRPVYLNSLIDAGRRGSPLDEYERPLCPECGTPMFIQIFKFHPDSKVKSRIFCPARGCDTAYNSDKTLEQWKDALVKRKEPENEAGSGSAGVDESKQV